MDQVRELESKHIVQTYRRTPIVLVRGKVIVEGGELVVE